MLTDSEIDAACVPAGWTPGPRNSDPDILIGSPWMAHLPLTERQRIWREREAALGARMVTVAGDRYGWTEPQREAARAIVLRVPVDARRKGRSRGVDMLAALMLAASRP